MNGFIALPHAMRVLVGAFTSPIHSPTIDWPNPARHPTRLMS